MSQRAQGQRAQGRSADARRVPARGRALVGALAATALVLGGGALAWAAPGAAVRVSAAREEVSVPAVDAVLGCAGPPTSYSGASSQLEGDAGAVAPATAVRAATVLPAETGAVLGVPSPPAAASPPTAAATPAAPVDGPALTVRDAVRAPEDGSPSPGPPDQRDQFVGARLTDAGGALATAVGSRPVAVVAAPVDGVEPLTAGSSTALATAGDLRGLATAPCVSATDQAWLLGGATGVGDSARLVLVNPSTTAATVRADVLVGSAPDGAPAAARRSLVALPEMSVGPGQVREVLLEGVAPRAASLAVHVRSDGADVATWLVTTSLRGLVPQGTDVVTAGDRPGRRQVVPGVVAVAGEAPPVLRLAAPGPDPVVARWQLSGPDGPVAATGARLAATVPASGTVDVSLEGLAAGTYTLTVEADAPVVAAVGRSTTPDAATTAGDLSWSGSARPLSGQVLLPVPPPPAPQEGARDAPPISTSVVLHAPVPARGAPPATVTLAALDATGALGAPSEVTLSGGTSLVDVGALAAAGPQPLRAAPVAVVVAAGDADAGVVAALVSTVGDPGGGLLVSQHAVVPAPVSSAAVKVRLRGSP